MIVLVAVAAGRDPQNDLLDAGEVEIYGFRRLTLAQDAALPEELVSVSQHLEVGAAPAALHLIVDADGRGEAARAAFQIDHEYSRRVRPESAGEGLPVQCQRMVIHRAVGQGFAKPLDCFGQVQLRQRNRFLRTRPASSEQQPHQRRSQHYISRLLSSLHVVSFDIE